MIETVITDFSRVLLFPKDRASTAGLNGVNNKLLAENPDYNFWDHFVLNEELLDYYTKLNGQIPTYIFTSETIQNHPAVQEKIKGSFSGILSALDFGLRKSESEIYKQVATSLNAPIETVLYIDDNSTNIAQAALAGMQTVLYGNNEQTIEAIRGLVPN